MPKKPRSQRRKKGTTPGGDGEDGDYGAGDVEVLSETHTVADSISTVRDLDDDFNYNEGDDADAEEYTGDAADGTPTCSRAATSAAARQTRTQEALSVASTIPSEKRTAKREQYLRLLFKAITQYATGDEGRETVLGQLDDAILPACLAGLRAGVASPAEQYAACRVLEATSVVLGGDMDEYCEAVDDVLRKAVKATGRAAQVRVAALRALSMSLFVCGTDMVATNSALDLCEAVCAPTFRGEEVAPTLRATALDCWALLSTTVADAYIAGDDLDGGGGNGRGVVILPLLQQCLNHANVELRCAAGECVALTHEARLNLGIDDDEGENATERRYRRGSWDGTEWEVMMDELKQRVAELSVESGHRLSKKNKKEQKATFREFMATIVDDESPCEVVSFRGGSMTLQSWREIIQLNFIRHCLQAGFQIQLMTNSTLQDIFGVDGSIISNVNAARLSQFEKRITMSKSSEASKAADKHMTRQRRNRTNVKNHFITADGDDI